MIPLPETQPSPLVDVSVSPSDATQLLHGLGQLIASAVWMILAWRAMRAHERAAGPSETPATPPTPTGNAGPSAP